MRRARVLSDGARYHITARANRKEMILDTRRMKLEFMKVLKRAKQKYDFRVENFCIMGNHFHLVVEPLKNANLSRIMQWIMSVFAMRFNRLRGLCGHVWGERFFSRIIHGLRELVKVFDYIDDNPVKAFQVVHQGAWQYGGLSHHQRGDTSIVDEPPDWLQRLLPRHSRLFLPAPGQ